MTALSHFCLFNSFKALVAFTASGGDRSLYSPCATRGRLTQRDLQPLIDLDQTCFLRFKVLQLWRTITRKMGAASDALSSSPHRSEDD